MPEKTLAEIPRNLRELYEKGNAALQKKNYDYAITIYNQVLIHEPGFYTCREALRACQVEKNKSGGGFFRKILGTASASPLLAKAQYQVRSNPKEALGTCEQILNADPHNAMANRLLADAATAMDFPKTAILSLEFAFKSSGDLEVGKRLGEALAEAGQIERAQDVYTELQAKAPGDTGISQALKNVAAKKSMRDQGYGKLESGTGSYRDILKDKEQTASLEQEQRQVKTADVTEDLISQYRAQLQNEPDNPRLLRSIAELYAQKKDFDTALEFYAKIGAEGQADPTLERAVSETRLRKMEHQIAQLDASADDYPERRAELEKERQEFEIEEARRRVERHPNDLSYRHELGVLYYDAGRVGEAIQEFQRSQHNPHKRISALHYLGLCFSKRNMHDMAIRSLQNAIAEKTVFDEEKKELIHALGTVFEKSGRAGEAMEQFKQIYEIDIGYKDVGAKVDAYYANAG